jgi:prolipoprotein diacylglyceryl transferase
VVTAVAAGRAAALRSGAVPVPVPVLAYIPSPPGSQLVLGPFHLRAYGLLIALGVFAAVWLGDRRWQDRGGEAGTLSSIALWAVPGGLVGARIYHVATDYELYTHHPFNAVKIWQGGLGIWGGVAGGVLVGWIVVRRRGLDMRTMLDAVAPALPLAQAIGRWGNYFNQELFGRPTKLPWALQVDPSHRPPGLEHFATFQPTFLYESLWDLAVAGLVLWAGKRLRLRRGYLFVLYVALYTFGRFWTELLRIDFAHKILGLRFNDWVSILIFAGAATLLLLRGRAPDADEDRPAEPAEPADPAEAAAPAEPAERAEGAEESQPAAVPAAGGDPLQGGGGVVGEGGDEVGPGPGEP